MNKVSTVRNRVLSFAALALIGVVPMIGCGGAALVKYDENTYQQVTFIKPQVLAVYDSFKTAPLDQPKIDDADLKLAQLQAYEAGKGPANIEMTQQVESIQKLFRKHVAERKRDGIWNDTVTSDHKEIIAQACDLAIKTERAKNK